MHICSEVEGKLKDGLDAFDAIESLLPAGTLSGAPKIRACEIIEELERTPRGVYGGALGYVDFNGTSTPVSLSEWRSRKMTRFMFRQAQAL